MVNRINHNIYIGFFLSLHPSSGGWVYFDSHIYMHIGLKFT